MPLLQSRADTLGAVLQHEYKAEIGYCRKDVVLNEAAEVDYVVGTVLGKVTATGKYKRIEATAVDGSEAFAGIYIGVPTQTKNEMTVPATTDTAATIIYRGPASIGKAYLSFGASVNTDEEKAVIYAQMEAAGIQVLEQPNSY